MQLKDEKINRKWREKLADEESPPCSGTLILLEQIRGECRSAAADGTSTVPFSLVKTSEVLQCTSHLDPLGRGERDWVNAG